MTEQKEKKVDRAKRVVTATNGKKRLAIMRCARPGESLYISRKGAQDQKILAELTSSRVKAGVKGEKTVICCHTNYKENNLTAATVLYIQCFA